MTRIEHPPVTFGEDGVPRSDRFGDIYFSPTDGLNETKTVFLHGNNLPAAWQGQANFTIAETGFGTGLNFLATVAEFAAAPGLCGHLHFISVEKFPLSRDQLIQALQPWRAIFPDTTDRLIMLYPLRIPGFHRLWFDDRVSLTLIFNDAVAAFSQLEASVDAWFLDGFSPAKNPAMWQDDLYEQMARLSHGGTSVASFTAAGDVRRGLQQAGFAVERVSGFANKRHRIVGHYAAAAAGTAAMPPPRRIAVIGAGLAGATLAQALQRYGMACTVFDRHPAPGLNASGNRLGLVNPKIDLGHPAVSDLGQSMFGFALHRLRDTIQGDIGFRQTGIVHAATDEARRQRQAKMHETLHWLPEHLRLLRQDDMRAVTGYDLPCDGLYFPDAATVNTADAVASLLRDTDVRWNTAIASLETLQADFDCVILASSEAARDLVPSLRDVLRPTRGQVTFVAAPTDMLKCPVTAGHYVAPFSRDMWVTGATFQRGRSDPAPDATDDETNIAALAGLLPGVAAPAVRDHWAQIRYATPDHRPLLGHVTRGVHVVAGLGSHGLQYGFLLAEIMAARLCGAPLPVGRDVLDLLHLNRYARELS